MPRRVTVCTRLQHPRTHAVSTTHHPARQKANQSTHRHKPRPKKKLNLPTTAESSLSLSHPLLCSPQALPVDRPQPLRRMRMYESAPIYRLIGIITSIANNASNANARAWFGTPHTARRESSGARNRKRNFYFYFFS